MEQNKRKFYSWEDVKKSIEVCGRRNIVIHLKNGGKMEIRYCMTNFDQKDSEYYKFYDYVAFRREWVYDDKVFTFSRIAFVKKDEVVGMEFKPIDYKAVKEDYIKS